MRLSNKEGKSFPGRMLGEFQRLGVELEVGYEACSDWCQRALWWSLAVYGRSQWSKSTGDLRDGQNW